MESHAEDIEIKSLIEVRQQSSEGKGIVGFLQKKLVRAALIATVALLSVPAVRLPDVVAGSFSTSVHVNAIVLARTQIKPLQQPTTLVVTDADVRQGYVEVIGASLFEIWNNNPAGCVLTFASGDFPFREAAVTVMGREIIIYPGGGMVTLSILGRQQIALNYRFFLTSDAEPGTYSWPLYVSANPL